MSVPIPRNDRQLREAHTLWSAPLQQIAALCGSTLVGQRVIASSLATLRGKQCIVKAPLSILGTARALAGEELRRRAAMQEIMDRYGPKQRSTP